MLYLPLKGGVAMNGEFKRSFIKYIFCLFFIFAGSFMIIRFSLWGIDEIQSGHISSSVFCFAFAFLGLLLGFLAIFVYQFNRNAFLKIQNGKIDGQFGWNEELHIKLNDITNAENQGKHLKLYIANNVVYIYNLTNAKDLCRYILSNNSKNIFHINNVEDAKIKCRKNKKSFITYLVSTIIVGTFMFINIGWCVFLTEGKDIVDFSKSDNIIFSAFAFAEIFTVLSALFLANKCGKKLEIYNISKLHILSAYALEHKSDDINKYPNVITRKYFDRYTYRIIVFAPYENIFAYILEKFDVKTLSWICCYESSKEFEILSELYDDLEDSFEDILLQD